MKFIFQNAIYRLSTQFVLCNRGKYIPQAYDSQCGILKIIAQKTITSSKPALSF